MSDTNANIATDTNATVGIKKEIVTFAVIVKLGADGKIKEVRHTSSEKNISVLEAPDYKGEETIAFKQPVVSSKLGSLDAFEELIPDADVRLDIINKGISAKFNQKIRTVLIEQADNGDLVFQPVEPSYDATPLLQEEAKRTTLSDTDKALKVLSGLDPDLLAVVMAKLNTLRGTAAE
jgi:hypothetical protein